MGKSLKVGYIRVSTEDQNTSRQLADIELDRRYVDKVSGKDSKRPELDKLLLDAGLLGSLGATLYIHSMDRLARNLIDMRKIVDELTGHGITVHFLKEALIFSKDKADARSELMFNMMAAFAQFERELIRERQREGIAIAKAAGRYKGGTKKLSPQQVTKMAAKVTAGEKKSIVAREYGISRETLYQYLRSGLPT